MTEKIGIDFDNTLVNYEGVFYQAAIERGLIPAETPISKGAVRDYLRSIGKESDWTELQGYIYGTRMELATPYQGVNHFFSQLKEKKSQAFIISHKTLHPFLGPPYDLHKEAKNWLSNQSFSCPSFFEISLEAKLRRIQRQKCTIFIDDLPEVLMEKTFPSNVRKILFDPDQRHSKEGPYEYTTSWDEITQRIYGS